MACDKICIGCKIDRKGCNVRLVDASRANKQQEQEPSMFERSRGDCEGHGHGIEVLCEQIEECKCVVGEDYLLESADDFQCENACTMGCVELLDRL